MNLKIDPKNDLWAFREGRKSVAGAVLFAELVDSALAFCEGHGDNCLTISTLIRAGEFETAIADAHSAAQPSAQQLTDAVASAFVGDPSENEKIRSLLQAIGRFRIPESLSISPPEGFAYYALHPYDFARLAEQVRSRSDSALVIGIRSIGTTLAAILRAALNKQGRKTERITVRPTGHPYDRVTHFTPAELQMIRDWNARGADFLVVDEGPGRSGSSFLSVAEALSKAGVARQRICLLGSRPVDVNQLCAENAPERWSQFTFLYPEPSVYTRFSDHIYIGGGSWRHVLRQAGSNLPVCWPQMERLKFLSPDRRWLYKFEGFGRFGEEVLSRAQLLARARFGCEAEAAGDGMLRYPVIAGLSPTSSDLSAATLRRLAAYCAFRAAEFSARTAAPTQLPGMLRFNVQQEFGADLGAEVDELHTSEPILCDGRMQPHEWICQADGTVLKIDACTHGDDHFFPGPTDIAWDLAGIIVEWKMDRGAAEFFLSEFRRSSGLDRGRVLPMFLLAYTVFRLAYCRMALSTVIGSADEALIHAAYRRYHVLAERQLRNLVNRPIIKAAAQAGSSDSSLQPGTAA